MMKKFVCHTKDLKDHQSYGFQLPLAEDNELDIVVLRQGKHIRAYLNHCPHLGIPLNWQPDIFNAQHTARCLRWKKVIVFPARVVGRA